MFIAVGLGSLEVMLNRGNRYDWFTSPEIQLLALATCLGLALFVWRSFTAMRPLVDLRVFKNRPFMVGTLLMFLLGFGLYGSFTMLPLFVQHMLGYTATWAGLVLSPGGLMSLLAMAFVGNLIGRLDSRLLVTFGAALNIAALWMLQDLYLGIDFWHVTVSRLVQGFGLGFLFVPLTTLALAGLRREQMGQATGLFNLLRNEGGSVGIAISSTILARNSQVHHARLVEHLTPGNPILQERAAALAHAMSATAGTNPTTAQQLTYGVIAGQIQGQAQVLAYVDVFWLLTLAFVCFVPFILFLGGKAKQGIVVAH